MNGFGKLDVFYRRILLVEFFNVGFYCLIVSRVNRCCYIRVFF